MASSTEEVAIAAERGFAFRPDARRGDPWPRFVKGDVHVWSILIRQGKLISYRWMRATLGDDGLYSGHEKFETLHEALNLFVRGSQHEHSS